MVRTKKAKTWHVERNRANVWWDADAKRWVVTLVGDFRFDTQENAEQFACALARIPCNKARQYVEVVAGYRQGCAVWMDGGHKAQVVVRKRNGQFAREFTYPRSSDPRRYKG